MGAQPIKGDVPMNGINWHELLDVAGGPDEVLRICRDYVESLDPADIERVPAACRPGKISSPEELSAFALELVRHDCHDERGSATLVRLAAFFAHANVRVAQILRKMNDPDAIVWKFGSRKAQS